MDCGRTEDRKDWGTPPALFGFCSATFGPYDVDVAASQNNALCTNYFSEHNNGLQRPWYGTVWCNPPYGREIAQWTQKAALEASRGGSSTLLVPARTDTIWFHRDALPYARIVFFKGRLWFNGATAPATFPSVLLLFGPRYESLERITTLEAKEFKC